MHFDDEAGDYAFGHEFILVTDDEVVDVVPLIFRLVGGEELGGDIGFRAMRDFVAEFEVFHQPEEFWAHVGMLLISPNNFEVFDSEVAKCGEDFGGVENFVDGGGAPFGFENDVALQEVIFLEMEADAEVVEVFAELEFIFVVFEAMNFAQIEKFVLGDVVAVVCFESIADANPGFWERGADVGELANVMVDSTDNFSETTIVGKVGRQNIFEVEKAAT